MWRPGLLAVLALCACGRRNFNVDAGEDEVDAAGPRANYVFATSSLHTSNLGGLAGADAICQARASAAGLTGTFVAYLSAGGVHASARLVGSRGWQRVDGKPVADTPAQFASLRQWYPISTDELGNDVRGLTSAVWTGAFNTGIANLTCGDWTGGTPGEIGLIGFAESGGARWTEATSQQCSSTGRIYCFELGQTTIPPPSRVAGRLAFISNAVFSPSGGVAAADALCTAEGRATGTTATFRAALPQSNVTMASRFDLTGPTWVRPDGVPIVDTAASMFGAAVTRAHLVLAADGQLAAFTAVWGGEPDQLPSAGDTCSDWTSTSGMAYQGWGDGTTRSQRFFSAARVCGQPSALLCLEE